MSFGLWYILMALCMAYEQAKRCSHYLGDHLVSCLLLEGHEGKHLFES